MERPSPVQLLRAAVTGISDKLNNLLPWSVIANGGRNQRAKFGSRALSTFRDRPAYLKMVLRYTGERSEQYRSNLEGMYKMLSTINC